MRLPIHVETLQAAAYRSAAHERDAKSETSSPAASAMLDLHRRVGNHTVCKLLAVGQPKLEVGPAGDRYELEADAVAREVMVALRSANRRSVTRSRGDEVSLAKQDGRDQVAVKGLVTRIGRRALGATGGTVDRDSEAAINAARGGGSPLDHAARTVMEGAFGADFSGVRVHADGTARELNARVQAKAFTVGADIFFRDAVPDARTAEGQQLLAHELTHTIQQGFATASAPQAHLSAKGLPSSTGNRVVSRLGRQRVMREFLPVARHREIVVDAAKRLADPSKASENQWITAIYKELEGEGNPAANRCVEKLIEQHIIDQADWDRIKKEYTLYKESSGEGFDLFERHAMPKIHNQDTADKWVMSLIKHRIDDLYLTAPGFPGHAVQVQLGITQLVEAYEQGKFNEAAFGKYKTKIIAALQKGKAKTRFAIPRHVYTFEAGSSTAI